MICLMTLLFEFLVRLLFVVLKIHYGFLSQFQVTLKLTLGALKVHTELFLLLQRTFKLQLKIIFYLTAFQKNNHVFSNVRKEG